MLGQVPFGVPVQTGPSVLGYQDLAALSERRAPQDLLEGGARQDDAPGLGLSQQVKQMGVARGHSGPDGQHLAANLLPARPLVQHLRALAGAPRGSGQFLRRPGFPAGHERISLEAQDPSALLFGERHKSGDESIQDFADVFRAGTAAIARKFRG